MNNKPKKGKRYNCPYCDYRNYRQELIDHVEDKHEDLIPKNYSASRVVYNSINKKDHGACMICHKDTEWDENKQRYNTLCKNPRCKTEYTKIVRSRMVKKYGTYNLLKDPEFQKKMLANRSISGKYKFQDGGSIGYVGSYEKKFLEFMDQFLHIKSYDIISPGPTIPYIYKGKEHVWITDFLYEPYNLVFDIKDGGDNPNTRDMKEYREKQIAKEKAIIEQGEYNYIRLTDNKFEQLISIFMELKENVEDKPLIRINEAYIEEENSEFINNITAFHLEPIIGKKIPNDGGWDEELYSKDMESAIRNDIKDNYRLKRATKVRAVVFTTGKNLKPIKLGIIVIPDIVNNVFDWEWEERVVLSDDDFDYLKLNPLGESYVESHIISSKEDDDMIQEGLLFNQKDIYYNFDKFENGDNNVLLITGLSGSGKSTLATQLASKYKAEYIELDLFEHCSMFENDDQLKEAGMVFYDYLSKRKELHDKLINRKLKGKELGDEIYKFIKYCVAWCRRNKNTKFIIEGIQIYEVFKDEAKSYPLIIKGSSAITSFFRKTIKREKWSVKELVKYAPAELKWLIKSDKDLNELIRSIKESYIYESSSNKTLYHLSQDNLDGKTLSPRIPSNFLIKNDYEDGKTKRVCFAKSIDGSLRGMSQNLKGIKLYVHIPEKEYNIYNPTPKEVPDCKITGEVWIKEPVKLKCIGQIEIIKDKGEDGIPYKYGNNIAELFDWDWKWIEKIDESYIEESTKSSLEKDYKPKGKKNLSSFKKVHITETVINKYKKEYPFLKHVRCKDTKEYICDGYIWFDNDKLAAMVDSCEYTDDKTKWIVSLEITKSYQGYGLSKQILDFAVKTMKCKYLSVNKNNEVAKKVYDDFGFKVYLESEKMYYMTIDKDIKESSINEEARIESDKLPKHIYHISSVNHNGETFEPRKYDNDNVKNGMERYVSRVCFSDSIQGCLYSIFPNGAYDADFYVHVPAHDVKVYSTTKDDVYDSEITHELWVKEPVEMKCIGKIHVSDVSNKDTKTITIDSDKVPYNKKKYHKCIWNWVAKYYKDQTLFENCIYEGKAQSINKCKYKECPECGSKEIGVFIQGEPIYKCKKCGKYLGDVPFE